MFGLITLVFHELKVFFHEGVCVWSTKHEILCFCLSLLNSGNKRKREEMGSEQSRMEYFTPKSKVKWEVQLVGKDRLNGQRQYNVLERAVIQRCLLPRGSICDLQAHVSPKCLATPAIDTKFNIFPRRNIHRLLNGHCLGLSAQMLIHLKLESSGWDRNP